MADELIYGLTAAALAGLLTNVLCIAAVRWRVALDPVSDRSNHSVPTPRLGGLSILGGVAGAVLLLEGTGLVAPGVPLLLALSVSAGCIGLIDDFADLNALLKLVLLGGLALLAGWFLGPVEMLPLPFVGWIPVAPEIGTLIAAFWILSIVNVINFMDGLNGLVGSFLIILFTAVVFAGGGVNWTLFAVQAAILGFLFCNVFTGRIFMGDAGSLSLGFLIGAAPLLTAGGDGKGFWMVPLVALPLIADVGLTLVRRALRGARLTEPHREHLYQRLKASGWSHQAVASVLLGTGVAAFFVAFVLRGACASSPLIYWIAAICIVLLWGGAMAGMLTAKLRAGRLEGTLR